MSEPPKMYHLADGMVLSIGPVDTTLVDLERDYEIHVDFRYVEPLEKVSLGWTLDGYEAFIPRLIDDNILQEGVAKPDPVLEKRLRRLDHMFMQAYADELSEKERKAYTLLVDAHARRKRFFERVGQCPVLPETALRRAMLVGDADIVGVQNVLCLGDDDLVSVALATLGHKVTVFDIDDFLLSFLAQLCEDYGLKNSITIEEHDLRDPLSEQEHESFDVFLTDPMSNRDCFEIFLSRAFALLKPDGKGFSAVYPPVTRLFHNIAEDMGFEIEAWFARHNRYYSKYVKLHHYESDWVQIRKTVKTVLPHAPTEFSVPLNLYREDYFQRHKSIASLYSNIDEPRFATPLFLDMIIDLLEIATEKKFPDRIVHMAQDWTLVHCPLPDEGYLNLWAHRPQRQVMLDMYPFDPPIEEPLRDMLMSAFKNNSTGSSVSVGRTAWDVRVR